MAAAARHPASSQRLIARREPAQNTRHSGGRSKFEVHHVSAYADDSAAGKYGVYISPFGA